MSVEIITLLSLLTVGTLAPGRTLQLQVPAPGYGTE
jgi:hypothetical protein